MVFACLTVRWTLFRRATNASSFRRPHPESKNGTMSGVPRVTFSKLRTRRALGTSIWLFLCAALIQPGCGTGPSETCEGTISRSCEEVPGDACVHTKPCSPTPSRCVSVCETGARCVSATCSCNSGRCFEIDGECRSRCESPEDQDSCTDLNLDCVWQEARCASGCESFSDATTCFDQSHCFWIECTGELPQSCTEFSGEDCPTALGCDRVKHYIVSTG